VTPDATPPARPTLIWDGDCGFCRSWIERWCSITGERVAYEPWQSAAERFPEIPRERFARAVQLIEPDGKHSEAAEAVFRSLAAAPGHGAGLWCYRHVPLFATLSEAAYRSVAGHRGLFTSLTRMVWGPHVVPPGERLTCSLYLRALGATFAVAFFSLWSQVIGLVGARGILPAAAFLDFVKQQVGAARFIELPTLCWLNASDPMLHALCAAGLLGSLALVAGLVPGPALLLAWACYLSLTTVCREFLWFQWDSLLLEAGFLALFLVPWSRTLRWREGARPSRAGLWLARWLLFRLMMSSAIVKLSSGDPTWRSLTALEYHYRTQPLPPWTAWYAHHLPAAFQKFSALMMFAAEGLAPLLIFKPRRIRFVAAGAIATLQLLIIVTGNYGFFNLLTLALCITLLDDGVWPWRWHGAAPPAKPASDAPEWSPSRGVSVATLARRAAAVALLVLSVEPFVDTVRGALSWPAPYLAAERFVEPFRVVNSYGLFAVMTTQRHEIVLEGSDDGATWQAYEFRWKPGDVRRRPEFMAPHLPRLDWQMWFAALGDAQRNPWLLATCERVLQGSPPVLALFAHDPFAAHPPKYLRAVVYDYRFTDAPTRKATGAWWTREPLGLYAPPLTLVNGRLAVMEEPVRQR
jgi:predicted DCC family thiol-disulfide oxidoreductase YuxK